MPENLKTLLERAEAPTMHVDPHAVLAGGRRRHRRRTAAATGLLTAVVAAVALGASAVHGLGRPSTVPASPISVASAPVSETMAVRAPRVSARVAIRVGHCHVEYVDFDGQTWGLTKEQQFGGGGGAVPGKWPSGRGLMERLSSDRARYTDDAGTVLDFRPVDDPAVLRIEGKLCA